MTTRNIFRKDGVPALARPSDVSSFFSSPPASTALLPCSLIVKLDETSGQAAVTLRLQVPVHGFDTDQRISFIYHADNWVSGEMKRRQERVPDLRYKQLVRTSQKSDFLDSLILVLRQPAAVICPFFTKNGNVAPKHGSDYPFQHMVALAKATKVSIVFDAAWLRPHKEVLLSTLFQESRFVNRLSYDSLLEVGIELDWTIFSPHGSAPPTVEKPPAYGDASLKRSERSPISSPRTPPSKRPLLDLGSPTEKATTITQSPSPRLLLPSPVADLRSYQDAVAKAVAEQLPGLVRAALPDTLAHIFGTPASPLPSPSNPTTAAIRKLLLNHLTTHATELAKQVTDDTLEHANGLRDEAEDEFQDQLQDQRNNLAVLKDDALLDVGIHYDKKVEEFRHETSEIVNAQQEVLEEACLEAQDIIDEFIRRRMLRLERRLLRVELELLDSGGGRHARSTTSRRARSLLHQLG